MAEKLDMNANNAPALPLMASAFVTATSGGGAMSLAQFEKLTTDGLTGMSKEDLVSCQVPMGVAAKIIKRIPL